MGRMAPGQGKWGTPRLPQHPWLWMIVKLGQAGTGLSHWANSKRQRSTGERGGFQTVDSQLLD